MKRALFHLSMLGCGLCLVAPILLGCQPPWLSGFLLAGLMAIGAIYSLTALCSGNVLHLPRSVLISAALLVGWLAVNVLRDGVLGVGGGRNPFASSQQLCFAGAFFCAAIFGAGVVSGPRELKRLLIVLTVLGLVLSVTSFSQALGYDLKKPFGESFYGKRINGIYTNPNRFAVMLTLCWLACIAVGGDALTRRKYWERSGFEMVFLTLSVLAIAVAIVLTLSRLTMISIAAWLGVAALWWVYLFRRHEDSATAFRNSLRLDQGGRTMILALLLPVLCMAAWLTFTLTLGRTELQQRLSLDPSIHSRFKVMALSLPLLTQNPIWGVGLSGFENAFAAIQPVELSGRWREVHNDWLQLALEAGLPALLFAAALVVSWIRSCACNVLDEWKANQHTFALRVLSIGGIAVALLCSAGDFPLREPATAAVFFMLAGAMCSTRAGASARMRPGSEDASSSQLPATVSPLDKAERPAVSFSKRLAFGFCGIAIALLLIAGVASSVQHAWAYAHSPWFRHIDPPKAALDLAEGWHRAAEILPADPELHYQASVCLLSGTEIRPETLKAAASDIQAALETGPRDFRIVAQAARIRELQGDIDGSAALREKAVERAPGNAWLRWQAGDFYIRRLVSGNLPGTGRREAALDAAIRHLRIVIASDRTRQQAIINKMDAAGCMASEIARLWPGDADEERIERSRFYFEQGQWAEVDRSLPQAVPGEPALATWYHAISGAVAFSRGDIAGGAESWNLALRCNPQGVTSGIPLEHWMLTQVNALGVDVCEQFAVSDIEPLRRYSSLSAALARVLIANRRFAAAEQVLSEWSLVSSDLCAMWAELALLTGDTETAAQRARRAWEQELSNPARAVWYDEFRKRISAVEVSSKGKSATR